MMRTVVLLCLILTFSIPVFAQFRIEMGDGKQLTITQAVQAWDVVSFRTSEATGVDARNDFFLRRGRLGVEGKVRSDISFSLSLAYDGIAKDKHTLTSGSANAADNHDLFVWDATWIYSVAPEFNVVFGYFRPQVGKEQMASEFNVISFDKSYADALPRLFLLGRSSGREGGINLGGLVLREGWSLNYNVGMFDPTAERLIGSGSEWSPLLTGRLALSIGDPEFREYRITYGQAGHGARHGVTIGVNAARQGYTEAFSSNLLYGVDILVNDGPLDIVAEIDWMRRGEGRLPTARGTTTDMVYSIKTGWRLSLNETQALEPAAMVTGVRPEVNLGVRNRTNSTTGASWAMLYDLGLNWLIDRDRFKVNAHYVWGRDYGLGFGYNGTLISYFGIGTQLLY